MSLYEEWPIQLNCVGCGAFRDFDRESETVIKCAECGKRHSEHSLHVVNPEKIGDYQRDEAGTLTEPTP